MARNRPTNNNRSLANRTTKVDSGQASKNLRNFDSKIIDNLKRNRKAGF